MNNNVLYKKIDKLYNTIGKPSEKKVDKIINNKNLINNIYKEIDISKEKELIKEFYSDIEKIKDKNKKIYTAYNLFYETYSGLFVITHYINDSIYITIPILYKTL